jgi:ATP-binding cassette subfamily B protein
MSGGLGGHGSDESDMTAAETTRRLLAFVAPHAAECVGAFLSAVATVLLQLYVPILIGNAIDLMVGPSEVDLTSLMHVAMILATVVVGAAVTQWLQGYLTNRLTYKTVQDMRCKAFSKIRRLPVSLIDSHPHGDLISRVVNDVDQVGDGLLQGLTQLFQGIVTIVGTLAFMLSISVPVAIIVIVVTPLSLVVATLVTRMSHRSFMAQQAIQGEMGGYVEEMVGNQRLVAAFRHTSQSVAGFEDLDSRLYEAGERAQFASSLSNPSTRFVNNVIYAIVGVVGCICVVTGIPSRLTVGQVQSFLSYANQYTKPFNEITSVLTQVQTAYASARRLFEFLDAEEESPDKPDATELRGVKGNVTLEDVFFSYDPARRLLENIDVDAKPGSHIALVGPTGCGKTTLINLLLRFYDVDAGRVLVDGNDVRDVTRDSLRKSFGMVLQDTWLFEGTVRDNIAYGRPEATDEEVRKAAADALADTFIERLPMGYDTVIGEDGGSLSQGQRQLLCIARVMLMDPAILLLDEATSSIDTRTEAIVQRAFDRMCAGRTSLIVAHRLSTVRDADCILVMRDGHIVERGSHDELLAAHGFYRDLYESQFAATASREDL